MINFILPIILLFSPYLYADLYFELAVEGGGDTLIGTTIGDNINAGSGVKLALGIQNQVGINGESLSLSLGYLFDNIDAFNGTAEIDTFTFDAIYTIQRDLHRFGIGASYHIDPVYRDNIVGFFPFEIEFEDAFGLILQYSYALVGGFQLGARFTNMDYEANSFSVNANSFGLFMSNGF